ncbi:hypothetical protein PHYPSEUDO_014615 [Phytophthora pseudosyringae]|uniref:EF-hand domain-containing protein n=1 Tax=Phytophthora pseudosyringae TaxID=221518 RepID=A0A8T1V4T2_9STRA|nr:hypothetical protein PHYPSEUDO_014615 [Phytophthora pseudosyringae]
MNASREQQARTATQVRALAATGLASSHLQPFVRLLYDDPRKTRARDRKARTILVESRAAGDEVICRRQRERSGKYTATWAAPTELGPSGCSGEVFNVHSAVNWVELQLWNRFDNGFDVFLGKASASLHQLQERCSEAVASERTVRDSLRTGALWFPLQTSEANGLASHLSLQVECIFTSDPKVLRIREEIQQRRKRKAKKNFTTKRSGEAVDGMDQHEASESGGEVDEGDATSIVDPAFAFTQPFLPVEWSLITSLSIRHLFFHADVERLANFRELVLFADLERELDEDEGLQIHDDHLAAFKACAFSAQYLDHCVETLSQRIQGYSEDYRGLADTRAQLARKNKALVGLLYTLIPAFNTCLTLGWLRTFEIWQKSQRRRLQKENDDLNLLIATYQRVLEKNGDPTVPGDELKQSISLVRGGPKTLLLHESEPGSAPISPTASISSKKPVFLMSWEERERERRLEKDISKAQRIEEEKQRMIQRVQERQQRDDYEALLSKVADIKKQCAARRIQAFIRNVTSVLHAQRCAVENRAATLVQAAWKRSVHVKKYPQRLEARKRELETLLMTQSEREMRQWLTDMEQKQREEATTRAMSPPESIQSNEGGDGLEEPCSPSTSPSKQVVGALVATWRKLHRVFVLAHKARGIDFHALFAEIDLRKDDVIDRAELRLGARSFGVRLDRKITRALITLIRTKCGVPSKPLLVTFEQFMTGFELTPQVLESADPNPLPDTKLEGSTGKEYKTNDPAVVDGTPDTPEDESIRDEALVMAVRAFRAAVYESATGFLAALGKPSTDYRAFRDALAHIFSEFDADGNGQLDVDELVACMSSFNLRLSSDKVSLLRELFVGDRESDKVGVAEFISFVLAHSSSTDEDELGLLGHRIREAIMNRVREAQAQTQSVENAVRLVFAAAYRRNDLQFCSMQEFMRALNRLRLGVTPAQLARLVVRLDRDGDRSISFDELLVWLRIRSKPSPDDDLLTNTGRATPLQLATEKAKALRLLLEKLASALGSPVPAESKKTKLTALFRQVDRDNSGKINQEELQKFISRQDLVPIVGEEVLIQLCGISTMPQNPAALVAQEMMALLDLNANGVTTLKELLTFAQYDTAQNDGNDPVVIEAMRKALKESENNDPERLVIWFSGLPGAIQAAAIRQGEEMKIRVAEFKTALRAKLGGALSVSMQTLDRVVESLDKDSSGWVTTSELYTWAFPPRDLEELLRLVIKSWHIEHQQSSRGDFAVNLYQRFDVDSNGSLAVRELLQGLVAFGLTLSEYEGRVLLISFDLDGDGCWSKSEFLAFVNKLFPTESLIESSSETPTTTAQHTEEVSDNPAVHVPPPDGDEGSNDSAYSDDDLLLESESSNGLSSPAYSEEEEVGVRPVEYSEDFAED